MQNRGALGTIEQNSDAGDAGGHIENDADFSGQVGATNSPEFADPETRPNSNPVRLRIHCCASLKENRSS
jgi:hypothetical protein